MSRVKIATIRARNRFPGSHVGPGFFPTEIPSKIQLTFYQMIKNSDKIFPLLLAFSLVFVAGCKDKMGGTYPMTIKVTLDGNPLEGATVSLVGVSDGKTAIGISDASGVATIKSTEGWDGVFPGEYTVTMKKTEYTTSSTAPSGTETSRTSSGDDTAEEENAFAVSRELLDAKYAKATTSGMTVTQEAKKGSFNFDLSSTP